MNKVFSLPVKFEFTTLMAAGTIFCDVNVDDNASSGILTSYSHCHNNFLNLSHQSCAFIPVAGSLLYLAFVLGKHKIHKYRKFLRNICVLPLCKCKHTFHSIN